MRLNLDRFLPRRWHARFLGIAMVLAWGIVPALGQTWLEPEQRVDVDLSADLVTVDGRAVSIDDFEERVLLVNFWATWCGPCRAEMPSMEALQDRLPRESFRILAITEEDPETVRAFLARAPYAFTVVVDRKGALTERLRIWSIPMTLVLDSHRRLVHFHEGARLWDTPEVIENLQRLLRE